MRSIIPPSAVGLLSETQGDARYRRRVDTIAALRNLSGSDLQGVYGVSGYYSANDGACLPGYYWSSSDGRADNGGTVIHPPAVTGNGRFIMDHPPGKLHLKWFGGKDDYNGTTWTNNTPPLQALVNYVNSISQSKGCEVDVSGKAYGFDSYVELGAVSHFKFVGSGTMDYSGWVQAAGSTLVACTSGMDLIRANATETNFALVDMAWGAPQFFNVNFLTHSTAQYTGRAVVIRLLNDYYFENCAFREFQDAVTINSEYAGKDPSLNVIGNKDGGDASWGNFHHCAFVKNDRYGIYSPYYAGYTVDGCSKFIVSRPGSYGIYQTSGPQVNVIGNKFDPSGTNCTGMMLGGRGNIVSANQFEIQSATAIGLKIASLSPLSPDDGRDQRVLGNFFYMGVNGSKGISISSGVANTNVGMNTYRLVGASSVAVEDSGTGTMRWDHLSPGGSAGQRCRVKFGATPPTISSATTTKVIWDAETVDTGGWHSNTTLNTQVLPGVAGTYEVTICTEWAASTTGTRQTALMVSNIRHTTGMSVVTAAQLNGDNKGVNVVTHQVELSATDYLEAQVYQDSGSPLAMGAGSYMMVTRLA